jgi:hypothetical protein
MIDTDRAVRACRDVVAVEILAPGLCRVVTLGGSYAVDARGEGCECPDKKHNLDAGEMCKHHAAAVLATDDTLPTPFLVRESLTERCDPTFALEVPDRIGRDHQLSAFETDGGDLPDFEDFRVVTDGGQTVDAPYLVVDHDNDNRKPADSEDEAEDMAQTAREFGSNDVEIVDQTTDDDSEDTDDKGTTTEVVAEAQPVDQEADVVADRDEVSAELSDRTVTDDPIVWLEENSGHFVDYVGRHNTPAINRKGFEVLSHFYDIDVEVDLKVAPEDNDFQFCRAKATATTPEGRVCEAFGSAHVDRGDDAELLIEMAGTRAKKRALSLATGVGSIAVEEIQSGGEQ